MFTPTQAGDTSSSQKEPLVPAIRASRQRTPPLGSDGNAVRTSRIPKTLQRSGSLRLHGEERRDPPPAALRREHTADSLLPGRQGRGGQSSGRSPASQQRSPGAAGPRSLPPSPCPSRRASTLRLDDWESRAVLSNGSPVSTEGIARNGTTFSSRCNKYVVHCAARVEDEHYLTPTQRTTRDLKRLRALLDKAHETIRQKDAEIMRLKHDLVVVRLRGGPGNDLGCSVAEPGHAQVTSEVGVSLNISELSVSPNPAEHGGTTPKAHTPDGEPLPSVGDSGTYDCLTSPSVSSKESTGGGERLPLGELEERLGDDWEATERWIEWEEKRLRDDYERQISELSRQHAAEYQEMKEKYNDKVEALLQKLSESNTRYFELRPQYDAATLRARQLELELEALRTSVNRRPVTADTAVQADEPQPDPTPAESPTEQVAALSHQLETTQQELDRLRACWGSMFSLPHTPLRACFTASMPTAAINVWTATTKRLQQGLYCQQLATLEAATAQHLDHPSSAFSTNSLDMDPPMRLQFLKSAVFHFLTDRDNYVGHLRAIAAVLQFTEWEVQEVERIRAKKLSYAV